MQNNIDDEVLLCALQIGYRSSSRLLIRVLLHFHLGSTLRGTIDFSRAGTFSKVDVREGWQSLAHVSGSNAML